jgi:hypothetical protein
MFNHSLEHVAAPGESLRQAAALLAPGGLCLVRLPTPDSEAAKRYRQHWIQIDAPRHLHLISRTALRLLGEGAGLTYLKTWDDGNAFQLWGSEQALRGISLEDPRSMSRGGEVFSRAQMVAWEAEVKSLIRQNRSDSVAMLFQRSS